MLKLGIMFSAIFLIGWGFAWWAMPSLRKFMGGRFVANFLLILLDSLIAPDALAFWFIAIVVTVATIRGRQDAICRMVLLAPLMPGVTLAVQVGGAFLGFYNGIICLTIAVGIACLISPQLPGHRPRGFSPEDAFAITLFLVFGVMAQRFDSFTGLLRGIAFGATTFLLPYWLVRNNVRSTEQVDRLIACIVASSLPAIVIALFEVRSGWSIADVLRRVSEGSGVAASSMMRGGAVRASGAFGNPLIFAYFMMLVTIGVFTCRRWFRKSAWRLCVVVVLIGFLTPQSRGAFVAIVPAVFVLLLARRRFGAASAVLATAGTGAFGLLLLRSFSPYINAMLSGDQADGRYDYRSVLFERGMQEFWKRPALGTSIENVLKALRDITQGQGIVDLVNTYLWIALVSGAVGFVAFVLLLLLIVRKLVARARRGERLEATRAARGFLLAALTMTAVNLASVSLIERLAFYMVVIVALSRHTAAELLRARRARPKPLAELALDYEPRPMAA